MKASYLSKAQSGLLQIEPCTTEYASMWELDRLVTIQYTIPNKEAGYFSCTATMLSITHYLIQISNCGLSLLHKRFS